MDIKQEEEREVKLEEIIIKEEYVQDSGCSYDPTNCLLIQLPDKQCEYEAKDKLFQGKPHVDEKLYKCNQCGFTTAYKNWSERHKSNCEMSFQRIYFCAHCSYSAKRKRYLKNHVKCHFNNKPFACERCDYSTAIKYHLKRHRLMHSNEKQPRSETHCCNQCTFKTIYKSSLNKHVLVHSKEKPYHCKQCDFKTIYKYHLKRHLLLHSGEESETHHCKQCDYKTVSKCSLRQHQLVHSDKLHYCQQCNYKTVHKRSLKRHFKVHTRNAPFRCNICEKGFKNKFSFARHLKEHTVEEKIFQCAQCSYQTTIKSALRHHVARHVRNDDSMDSTTLPLDLDTNNQCKVFKEERDDFVP